MLRDLGRVALLALFCLSILGFSSRQGSALRLSTGDVLTVVVSNTKGFDGEYTVLSDGSISGAGFGRIVVSGKTLAEAQKAITLALGKRIKNPRVELILKSEFAKHVYFVGSIGGSNGVAIWQPNMSLQVALSKVKVEGPIDMLEVTLYRGTQEPKKFDYQALLRGQDYANPIPLNPGDLISVMPVKEIRVWVLGRVQRAGEIKVREGTGLYEAVAQAGGLEKGQALPSELKTVLRRGDQTTVFSAEAAAGAPKVPLESGDTIFVEGPKLVKVTDFCRIVRQGVLTLKLP